MQAKDRLDAPWDRARVADPGRIGRFEESKTLSGRGIHFRLPPEKPAGAPKA